MSKNIITGEDVLKIIHVLANAGINVWLDGGWAVDAIIRKQTRNHEDLDVVVELNNVEEIKKALVPLKFTLKEDELPTRFVLEDSKSTCRDFHTVTFNSQRGGVQKLQNGREYTYPAQGFVGVGEIDGQKVKCLTAEVQADCHYGYESDDKDKQDMKMLNKYCGIILKEPYL